MMEKKSVVIVFILLFFFFSGNSQQPENPAYFGSKFHRGIIWAHYSQLDQIAKSNPWGVEISWSRVNTSQKAWESCNCYSKVGLSFNYFNYEEPEILGNSYNLIAFAEPFLNFNRDFYYTFRAGIGATYLNQVYDEETNPQNLFYSSPLSFILTVSFDLNYKITSLWHTNFSATYNHISNGGIKKPNKGMNFPTLSLGVDYVLNPEEFPQREKVKNKTGDIKFYTRFFTTRPDVPPTDNLPPGREWLFGLAAGAQTTFASFHGINLGIEVIQDNSLKEKGVRQNINKDHHMIAALVGHHLLFGKFDFNQQLGFYIYKPFPFTEHKIYQRYELAYFLTDKLIIGTSLKAHAEVAENFDIRIGLLF